VDHINYGYLVLHEEMKVRESEPRTIIVSGVGRSGTSMMARLVEKMGIPLGETHGLAVHEDQDFLKAFQLYDRKLLDKIVFERNTKLKNWGFKFPALQNYIFPPQLDLFRNPYLILMSRDPVAVAKRSTMSDEKPASVTEALEDILLQMQSLVRFAKNSKHPTLLLSYEKALLFPENVVTTVADFCGVKLSKEQIDKCVEIVTPNDEKYISLFHADVLGYFDGIKNSFAVGWCRAKINDDPIEVELFANNERIASTTANLFRPDLATAGIGNGHHGFAFDLANFNLAKGTILQVRVAGGGHILEATFGSRSIRLESAN